MCILLIKKKNNNNNSTIRFMLNYTDKFKSERVLRLKRKEIVL